MDEVPLIYPDEAVIAVAVRGAKRAKDWPAKYESKSVG
jgi:hypothetical protein